MNISPKYLISVRKYLLEMHFQGLVKYQKMHLLYRDKSILQCVNYEEKIIKTKTKLLFRFTKEQALRRTQSRIET